MKHFLMFHPVTLKNTRLVEKEWREADLDHSRYSAWHCSTSRPRIAAGRIWCTPGSSSGIQQFKQSFTHLLTYSQCFQSGSAFALFLLPGCGSTLGEQLQQVPYLPYLGTVPTYLLNYSHPKNFISYKPLNKPDQFLSTVTLPIYKNKIKYNLQAIRLCIVQKNGAGNKQYDRYLNVTRNFLVNGIGNKKMNLPVLTSIAKVKNINFNAESKEN